MTYKNIIFLDTPAFVYIIISKFFTIKFYNLFNLRKFQVIFTIFLWYLLRVFCNINLEFFKYIFNDFFFQKNMKHLVFNSLFVV